MQINARKETKKKNRNEKTPLNCIQHQTEWMARNNLLIILLNVVIYELFTCEI